MKKIIRTFSSEKARKSDKSNQHGIALVLVLIALALATMLGLAVASSTSVEVQIANSSENSNKTFYYAESGLNMGVAMIKRMNGNFNDLLAGPPEFLLTNLAQRLQTHGNEFVINDGGLLTLNGWPITSILLPGSGLNSPMFGPDVKAFKEGSLLGINLGGDGLLNIGGVLSSLPAFLSGLTGILGTSNNMKWGGKLEFDDTIPGSRYVVLIEVYDDDDPLARIFNAYPDKYPNGYTGSTSDISYVYKVPGADPADPNSYNSYDDCDKDFVECPGEDQSIGGAFETRRYGSFSGQNKDRNARVMLRSTARHIVKMNNVDTVAAETVLDTIVGFYPYPAVITNGCSTVQGSTDILGAYGGIHANEGLCLGNDIKIDQTATSSSSICAACPGNPPTPCPAGVGGYICGFSGGNQPTLPIPDLNPLTVAGDANPPSPLHVPGGTYNGVAGTTNGGFWIRDVVDLSNPIDEKNPLFANQRGSDIVLVSPTGTSGSRRSQILSILGITSLHLLTAEFSFGSFDRTDALVIDRTGLGLPGTYRIASINGANTGDWYILNTLTGLVLPGVPLIPGAGNGNKYGWSAGSGTTASSCGSSSCNASCSKPSGSVHATNGITWSPSGLELLNNKIFFIDGNANITGNLGSGLSGGLKTTLITTGFIDIQDSPDLTAKLQAELSPIAPPFISPKIIFLAGTDINMRGDVGTGLKFDGIAFAREQVSMSGTSAFKGQVIAGDFSHDDGHVCYNNFTGTAAVTFGGSIAGLGAIKSSSWRIMKF